MAEVKVGDKFHDSINGTKYTVVYGPFSSAQAGGLQAVVLKEELTEQEFAFPAKSLGSKYFLAGWPELEVKVGTKFTHGTLHYEVYAVNPDTKWAWAFTENSIYSGDLFYFDTIRRYLEEG